MRFFGNFYFNSRYLQFQNTKVGCAVILQARAKCFVLQRMGGFPFGPPLRPPLFAPDSERFLTVS